MGILASFFPYILLISLNGVFGSSDICRESLSSACIEIRPMLPKTEEELEKVCLMLERTRSCVRNYAENCGNMEMDEMYRIDAYSGLLTRICGTDTLLHHSVMGCSLSSFFSCSIPEDEEGFPKSGVDIDRKCPYYIGYLECLKDYADMCGYEKVHRRFFTEGRYKTLKHLLEDICQKESQLHLRLGQNIGCISEIDDIAPYVCRENLRNWTKVLMEYTSDKEDEGNYDGVDESTYEAELWTAYRCVSESLYVVCFASETSKKCGSDALEVVLELVRRSGAMKDSCPSVREDQINERIRILELELEEERFLREIILNKR